MCDLRQKFGCARFCALKSLFISCFRHFLQVLLYMLRAKQFRVEALFFCFPPFSTSRPFIDYCFTYAFHNSPRLRFPISEQSNHSQLYHCFALAVMVSGLCKKNHKRKLEALMLGALLLSLALNILRSLGMYFHRPTAIAILVGIPFFDAVCRVLSCQKCCTHQGALDGQ